MRGNSVSPTCEVSSESWWESFFPLTTEEPKRLEIPAVAKIPQSDFFLGFKNLKRTSKKNNLITYRAVVHDVCCSRSEETFIWEILEIQKILGGNNLHKETKILASFILRLCSLPLCSDLSSKLELWRKSCCCCCCFQRFDCCNCARHKKATWQFKYLFSVWWDLKHWTYLTPEIKFSKGNSSEL